MSFEYFNPLPHLAKYRTFGELLSRQDTRQIDHICRKLRRLWSSEQLTPNQRRVGASLGQEIDRVPCIISSLKAIGMKKHGLNYLEVYKDPVVWVKATLISILETKCDGGRAYLPIDLNLSDVFGTKWEFLPDSLPKVTEWAVTRGLEDILENPLPDPRESEALRWSIESMKFLNEKLGDLCTFSTGILAIGPYYMYNSYLRGPTRGLADIKKQPDLAVQAFDKLCDYIIGLLKYLMQAEGANSWTLIEGASPAHTSPDCFERYCAPYARRMIQELAPALGTIDGGWQGQRDFTLLLDTYAEMGFKGFAFGPPTELPKMKQISSEKGIFVAHRALTQQFMRWATPVEIEEQVKKCVAIGAPGRRYLLTTDMPDDDTPLDNLLAITEACRKYGKYPANFKVCAS